MVELIARWGEQWAHEHADNLEEKTLLFDESYESPTQLLEIYISHISPM